MLLLVISVLILLVAATVAVLYTPVAWDRCEDFDHRWRIADRVIGKNPTPEKHQRLLEDFHDEAKRAGLEFWLAEGTALGIYRGDGIIPWDTDVDVSINEDQLQTLKESVIPAMRSRGCRVMRNHPFSMIRDGAYIDIDIVGPGRDCMAIEWPRPCEDHMPYVHPLEQIEFNGRTYSTPGEKFFAFMYGKDWRTPKENLHSNDLDEDLRIK